MAKFKMGGAGPDGRGLGNIAGISRRFDSAGEVYETDAHAEVEILRCLSKTGLVTEVPDPDAVRKAEIENLPWKDLISLSSKLGVFKPGMKKLELINKIMKML